MSSISKRELIKQAYPHSPKWVAKVNKMTENQVTAIFFSLRRQGKL